MDDRDEAELSEFSEEPCMTDCAESIEITMRAAVLDVTPEQAGEVSLEGRRRWRSRARGTGVRRPRPRIGRRR
jgi:hypothetical protein